MSLENSKTVDSPEPEDIYLGIDRITSPSKCVRNYWRKLNPSDFVNCPEFTPMPYLKEVRLIQQAQAGNQEALNKIWTQHSRLSLTVVNRFHVPSHLLSDAIQEGIIGVRSAILKYKAEKLNSFSTYAWYWVFQKIQRYLEYNRHFVRIPVHLKSRFYNSISGRQVEYDTPQQELSVLSLKNIYQPISIHDISPDDHPAIETANSHEKKLDTEDFLEDVKKSLNQRHYFVVKHRYGLGGMPPKTLEEVAAMLKLTRERIRQIEKKALEKLQYRLPGKYSKWVLPPGDEENEFQQATRQSNSDLPQANPTLESGKRETTPVNSETTHTILKTLFNKFTYRQANALIQYYGLLDTPRMELSAIAYNLGLSPHKTRLAIRKGRRKLLRYLSTYKYPDISCIYQLISTDTHYENTATQTVGNASTFQ